MKHLILGTAGHVDHGKTALVKALTGIDCDTHKEEKRRGITINLGFAHCALPDGNVVGIVDVPGHRDFVNTMVSGASGVDFALLVVAADAGIMPQTREHVSILELLGIKRGVVAVTKSDLVDAARLEEVHGLLGEFTKNTFMEFFPVCDVSSVTGAGIDGLKRIIAEIAHTVPQRKDAGVFRMYIDRIFSVSGFGTVVTGSVKSGALKTGQTAYLLPPGKELRARRLERYGIHMETVSAGDRASCNLVGLNKDDFRRGMIIADRVLKSSTLLDASLALFAHASRLGIWTRVIFLMDAFETQARIHLIDKDALDGGGRAIVQIHLNEPCIAQAADRFVIRSTSGETTLGGGEIIDAAPLHHRRRPEKLVDALSKMARGSAAQRIAARIRKHGGAISLASVAESLNYTPEEVAGILDNSLPEDILEYGKDHQRFFIDHGNAASLEKKILDAIKSYHALHPLESGGRTAEELLGILGMDRGDGAIDFLTLFLEKLVSQGVLRKTGATFALESHRVSISPEVLNRTAAIEAFFRQCGMRTPQPEDLERRAREAGIDDKQLNGVLKYLVDKKILYAVEGACLHAETVDACRKKLLAALLNNKEEMTVARFRDLVSGNRKICLLLFAIFDKEGITRREGDVRVITEKGKAAATAQ